MTHSTSKLIPAEAQRDGRLTVFPLLADGEVQLPYLLLADAMESGTLRITEIGQGTVPALLALNQGDADVLVLDGEQLIGAKQNRMPNRTILLPAKSETRIPVSCMEQGRWHYRHRSAGPESADSLRFRHEAQHSPSKIRRHVRNLEAKLAMDGMGWRWTGWRPRQPIFPGRSRRSGRPSGTTPTAWARGRRRAIWATCIKSGAPI
jgi:hypothetical protein